jgi:hypothetical protein
MSNTDPTKNQGWTQVLAKGKRFLLLIRHLMCYSYIQGTHGSIDTLLDLTYYYFTTRNSWFYRYFVSSTLVVKSKSRHLKLKVVYKKSTLALVYMTVIDFSSGLVAHGKWLTSFHKYAIYSNSCRRFKWKTIKG